MNSSIIPCRTDIPPLGKSARRVEGRDPKAMVVGLGRTGLSVARFLATRGWSITVTDTHRDRQTFETLQQIVPGAEIFFGDDAVQALSKTHLVVASPGVAPTQPLLREARARGLEIVGDIELFAREHASRLGQVPIAGITGTNGKSTVTALVGDMAEKAGIRVAVGGNIGTPALDLLSESEPALFVLELSSFQLDTTQRLPLRVAAVLNLAEDHLDRYGDMPTYAASKARIFEHAEIAVVNADDPWVTGMPVPKRSVTFSLEKEADYYLSQDDNEDWLIAGSERVLPAREMKLIGRHNEANALAALAIGDALGLPRSAMRQSLQSFVGLPHRMEWVADVEGVRYINDSKGTNVGATLAAVAGLKGNLVLIAGGDGKGQDFAPLARALSGRTRLVVLIGRDAMRIAEALSDHIPSRHAMSMAEAVAMAGAAAQAGDSVLLSPACSSLDMFRDYAHRGAVFRQCVTGVAVTGVAG